MTDQQKPLKVQLWTVLDKTYWDDLTGGLYEPDAEDWQVVIRALADWLVPEEPEPQGSGLPFPEYSDGYESGKYNARQEIRRLLLQEADTAREVGTRHYTEPESTTKSYCILKRAIY